MSWKNDSGRHALARRGIKSVGQSKDSRRNRNGQRARGSVWREDLDDDVIVWHNFRIRKNPDKEIKKHESNAYLIWRTVFGVIPEPYDKRTERQQYRDWEKYRNEPKLRRTVYEYDGNYFIIYDYRIWEVEKFDTFYKIRNIVKSSDEKSDVDLTLLEGDD